MTEGKNEQALRKAGVIPHDYHDFSPHEKAAMESLSDPEIDGIIAAKGKLGLEFFKKHVTVHGFFY